MYAIRSYYAFPQLEGVRFTHCWGGTLAVTQDGMPSVGNLGDADNISYNFV